MKKFSKGGNVKNYIIEDVKPGRWYELGEKSIVNLSARQGKHFLKLGVDYEVEYKIGLIKFNGPISGNVDVTYKFGAYSVERVNACRI